METNEPVPVATPAAVPAVGKPQINIDDFSKIEVKVGTVVSAERVPETDKLLRLTVDFGEAAPRQIVSGIAAYVPEPETLVGRQLAFVTNLAPRTIKGLESNGMLFAVGSDDSFAFLTPDRSIPPGTAAH
jgi:methionyl-tRNA synthetase